MYRLLSGSCNTGPCGTFYVDDETGDVLVQGYLTTRRPPKDIPDGEDVLHIPADQWAKLIANLPR